MSNQPRQQRGKGGSSAPLKAESCHFCARFPEFIARGAEAIAAVDLTLSRFEQARQRRERKKAKATQ